MGLLAIIISAVFGLLMLARFNTSAPKKTESLIATGVPQEKSRFVTVNGARSHFISRGQGEHLLLIHGSPSSTYTWNRVFNRLSEQYAVTAFDMIGHGLTDSPAIAYNCDVLVEFTKSFMDAIGIERATIVGHSCGGEVAWRMALQNPEKVEGLILISPAGYPRDLLVMERMLTVPIIGDAFAAMSPRPLIRRSLRETFFDPAQVTDDVVDQYYLIMKKPGNSRAYVQLTRQAVDSAYESIPKIRKSTLIIWGAQDLWIPAEHGELFHRDIPGSELIVLPRCGHMPHEEKPDIVVPLVRSFMERMRFS